MPTKHTKILKITGGLTPQQTHAEGMKVLLTTSEVSQRLQVDEATVRKWLRHGKIAGIKLSGKAGWRVREDVLTKWLEAQEVNHG